MAKTPEETVLDFARQAGLLFNEENGTPIAQKRHKERILAFARLVVQEMIREAEINKR